MSIWGFCAKSVCESGPLATASGATAMRQTVSARSASNLDWPVGELQLLRNDWPLSFVPSDPAKLSENCYEAYNIQVQGLTKRLRRPGQEVVIGVSGGLDSTQALIVCGARMDRAWSAADRMCSPTRCLASPRRATKKNAWLLMKALGVTAHEIDIRPAARQMLADIGHPSRAAKKLRRDLRERAGRAAYRLSVPPRQPQRCVGFRHRRPVGTRARLVHLRRRRSHVALQPQWVGFEDADPAPDPLCRPSGDVDEETTGTLKDSCNRDFAGTRAGRA